MKKIKKVLIWLRDHIWTVVVASVALLGAGIFWSYYRGQIRSLQTQQLIDKAHGEVARIDKDIAGIEERKVINASIIQQLEEEKNEIKKRTLSLERDISEMSNEEVERAFQNLY